MPAQHYPAGIQAENRSQEFQRVAAYFKKFKAPPFLVYNIRKDRFPGAEEPPRDGFFLFADSTGMADREGLLYEFDSQFELKDLRESLEAGQTIIHVGSRPTGAAVLADLDFGLTMRSPTIALQFLEGSFRFGNNLVVDVEAGELFGYVRQKPTDVDKPTVHSPIITLPAPVEVLVGKEIPTKPGRFYANPRLSVETPLGVRITNGLPGDTVYRLTGMYYPFGRQVWWEAVDTV